ncbi:TVP38/TMEM64 family protein [Lederbergia galactosidilytica]|uniref:Alkaline phosphatase n=1 Tax=Lederbergia galactosidilytica TaxID=217031 RepID=A0A177ZKY9_9BACI|nr:VTT domain-containing protein [Lederbergia galactosidilytica]MBP1915020.1 putative membrane protein YdjX (TVP38/TMEM64 family) [Lederbergia galactosidilytica]OAK68253.1 alkaline phosphatase [Lederbergia galactosidilytica]
MNEQLLIILTFVQGTGTLAPIIFIFFHVIRQFIFIPVIMVCMVGGILFGSVLGTLFSMTGLLILSALFYFCIRRMPNTYEKLLKIKNKWFGRYAKMTVGQIAILRLIPFFHYHLLNLCLLERRPDFKGFMKGAFATNLPLAFFYTVFGEFITHFTPTISVIILLALLALVYILREKMSTVAWNEFFSQEEKAKNVCS